MGLPRRRVVKNLPANAGDARDLGWISGLGRSPGWEDPLEVEMATCSSILPWKNPMDRGAWWATVHGVAKNQTRLSRKHTYTRWFCVCLSEKLPGCFPQWLHHFPLPPAMDDVHTFSISLPTMLSSTFFIIAILEGVSSTSFWFLIFISLMTLGSFNEFTSLIYTFFEELSIQNLCAF